MTMTLWWSYWDFKVSVNIADIETFPHQKLQPCIPSLAHLQKGQRIRLLVVSTSLGGILQIAAIIFVQIRILPTVLWLFPPKRQLLD
jgi:hypothetical protein